MVAHMSELTVAVTGWLFVAAAAMMWRGRRYCPYGSERRSGA
jgi:hypothetical protein